MWQHLPTVLIRPLKRDGHCGLKICIFYTAAPPYCPGAALGGIQTRTCRRAQGACVVLFVCTLRVHSTICVLVCVCVCLCVRVNHEPHEKQKGSWCRRANLPTNSLLRTYFPPFPPVLLQAVVFCLVDLYRALGEDLIPHLDAGLSNSQLKLVTIYINRLQA